jgi:hypothetical protein
MMTEDDTALAAFALLESEIKRKKLEFVVAQSQEHIKTLEAEIVKLTPEDVDKEK